MITSDTSSGNDNGSIRSYTSSGNDFGPLLNQQAAGKASNSMKEKILLNEILLETTMSALRKKNFDVVCADTPQDALRILTETIPQDSSIGVGGSRTLDQISFFDTFNVQHYPNYIDRYEAGISAETKREREISMLSADVFVSSCNGISQTGELVLIDGNGNRCGGMTFGPKKRIVVAGVNKIAADLSAAMSVAQNRASVMNNLRFDTKNPCTITGRCMNCASTNRICNVTTILHRAAPAGSILVVLVKEDLGF